MIMNIGPHNMRHSAYILRTRQKGTETDVYSLAAKKYTKSWGKNVKISILNHIWIRIRPICTVNNKRSLLITWTDVRRCTRVCRVLLLLLTEVYSNNQAKMFTHNHTFRNHKNVYFVICATRTRKAPEIPLISYRRKHTTVESESTNGKTIAIGAREAGPCAIQSIRPTFAIVVVVAWGVA